ncbi:hypothetical protein AMS68_002338 [Peltaster fructicola]|uniref:very-long-chain enoyl-CoA reductase n=1 Tax=Peltaster fructicola TaxID=286661 RepID=A0A6H0XQ94_9PEZI|nr:hypothetical protein AMS68_002338 [Peltaster fructicola]
MASKPVILTIQPRGKPIRGLPKETSTYIQGSTNDLYHRIAAESKFSVHRLKITTEDGTAIPNEKTLTIESAGLKNGDIVKVKDLGPQIAWRTVFIIEYLGPIIIHPLIFFLRPYIYGSAASGSPSLLQTLSFWMVVLHFVKRELETLFVHRFSLATMPQFNVFKNSAYYWVVSGFFIAYFTYGPNSAAAAESIPSLTFAGLALYLIGELGNLYTHLVLRGLRSAGGTERGVPQGFVFKLVTCPNYMFETLSWIGILLITRSWASAVFAVMSVTQMGAWAWKKEKRYRKEMGAKYQKKRYAMLPGLI